MLEQQVKLSSTVEVILWHGAPKVATCFVVGAILGCKHLGKHLDALYTLQFVVEAAAWA
jgi:hypothetical protein